MSKKDSDKVQLDEATKKELEEIKKRHLVKHGDSKQKINDHLNSFIVRDLTTRRNFYNSKALVLYYKSEQHLI